MINSEVAISKYVTVITTTNTWYPIGFEYRTNPRNNEPELIVMLDRVEQVYGVDYEVGPQGVKLLHLPPVEEPEEPEEGEEPVPVTPADEIIHTLVITRKVPFIQDIDFKLGRIDPEQIEEAIDKSLERDQQLLIGEHHIVERIENEVIPYIEEVEEVAVRADEQSIYATELARQALSDAAAAQQSADDAREVAEGALAVANRAETKADEAMSQNVAQDADINLLRVDLGTTTGVANAAKGQASAAMEIALNHVSDIGMLQSRMGDVEYGVNTLRTEKQDKLTPGSNITIEDNVISVNGRIGGGAWGEITGNIDDQADLKEALDNKRAAKWTIFE